MEDQGWDAYRLIGTVDLATSDVRSLQTLSERRGELGHLFVEPAWQRRGIGRLLIADALQRARARGFRVLEIQGDSSAAQFYERVGARRNGERRSGSVTGRMLPLFELAVV